MESSQKTALGFIFGGLFLVGLFFLVSKNLAPSKSPIENIALAALNSGDAYIWKSSPGLKEKLNQRTWLKNLESIETMAESDVSIEFPTNYQIRVQPQSLITFEEKEGTVVMNIKKGDIDVEAFGKENSLFILKEGQKISAIDYGLSKTQKSNPEADNRTDGSEKLTQKMIQDVLKNTKNQFYKCYTQLLQKTPGVSGQASISFTILASGRVSSPEVSGSTLSDPSLKKCLINVIERVEFPSFRGPAVQTSIPIRFE